METHQTEPADSVAVMLKKLSALWQQRAAVNQGPMQYADLAFDPAKHDFSASLLPFRDHDAWRAAPKELKSRCLSYAWGIYNLKTVYIECDVVTPACEDLIKVAPANSRNRDVIQDVMSQALLDEALHTRMSLLASNYIYAARGLAPLEFTSFNLVQWRRAVLASCNAEWERRLTRFAMACASETLITDYLKTMAEDSGIQSVCHRTTKTHAMDEWSHSSVFSFVATDLVSGLSQRERSYLRAVILKTVEMFANNEMGAWSTVFSMLQFPGAADILADGGPENEIGVYRGWVLGLIARIGLDAPALASRGEAVELVS